jgi:hypothetical protein
MSIKLLNILKEEMSEQVFALDPYIKDPKTGKYQKNYGWNFKENRPNKEGEVATKAKSETYSSVYDSVDTSKYPNLDFAPRTKNDKINPYLLRDVNTAAEKSGVRVQITFAITGHDTGDTTRHDEGDAVDLSVLNGKGSSSPEFKSLGDKVVSELKKLGYELWEGSCGKKYLWQVSDHYDHVHVSYKPCN